MVPGKPGKICEEKYSDSLQPGWLSYILSIRIFLLRHYSFDINSQASQRRHARTINQIEVICSYLQHLAFRTLYTDGFYKDRE